MAFDNTNKANVAFKNLQNKSHTDATKEIGAEADSIFLNIDSTTIFTDTIDPNSTIAQADGVAFEVTAELVYDTSSNNQAWRAVWPNPLPAGAPDGVLSGDRVTNSISAAYGVPYEAKPYDVNDDLISPGDPRAWIYQYQSGIFYQQDNVGPLPKEIKLYVYTGTYLKDALENAGSGDVSSINYAAANMDMTCLVATIGNKVSDTQVVEFPISDSLIKLNGVQINVGEGKDCYFSPDGIYIRPGASAAKGDYLYWNSDKYDLDTIDEVDFVYMVSNVQVVVGNGDTISIEDNTQTQNLSFTGGLGETAIVDLNGELITVGNVAGDFVWDIGGVQEHTFTLPNEYITVIYSTLEYVIWYDGAGSLLFSLKNIIPVELDLSLSAEATSGFGTLACNSGLTSKPYDLTDIKVIIDSPAKEFTTGAITYEGFVGTTLTPTSTGVDGDYAFNGDAIGGTNSAYTVNEGRDSNILLITSKAIYGYNIYNKSTNTNTFISAASTEIGGEHEVGGTPMPSTAGSGVPIGAIQHSSKNLTYIMLGSIVWEYNEDTNIGTIVIDLVNSSVRGHIIDEVDDILYVTAYAKGLVAFDIINRTSEIITSPDSGDGFVSLHTSSIQNSPDGDIFGMAFAGNKVAYYIEKGTSTIGVRLDTVTTALGGTHEVLGDPLPANTVEIMTWMTNSNGDQIAVYSLWGQGAWLYNVDTNTGTYLSPTTTAIGGTHEVIGDPMLGVNTASVYCKDFSSKIYIGSEDAMWIYDIDTNVGETINIASTTSGPSKTELEVLPGNAIGFSYGNNTTYFDDDNSNLYLSSINPGVGIYVYRPNGYTLYDYAWFEDAAGNKKSKYALEIGDKLYWNPAKTGFELAGTETISYKYYM